MAEKKQKRPVEAINGLYGAIPHAVLDSVAFKGASYPTKALIFDLMRQHSGNNNGHLHLSFSWLEGRGWKSRDVIQRARAELIKRNLLIQTRQGGLNIGASRYAVTWLKISNFIGLDIQAKDYKRIDRTATHEIQASGKWRFALLRSNAGRTSQRATIHLCEPGTAGS